MKNVRLTRQEFLVMETLWRHSEASIREIQEALPASSSLAYTTVQTVVYRLETKGVVKRTRKVGNYHLFAAVLGREAAQRKLIDELLSVFGGDSQPLVARLVETGKLTLDDVKDAEKTLKSQVEKKNKK